LPTRSLTVVGPVSNFRPELSGFSGLASRLFAVPRYTCRNVHRSMEAWSWHKVAAAEMAEKHRKNLQLQGQTSGFQRFRRALPPNAGKPRPPRRRPGSAPPLSAKRGTWGTAFRLGTEFVAAVLVGGGFGYLIDRLLGTLPFGLIIMLLAGFAAGILNMARAAGRVPKAGDRLNDEP
jgi:F0F1-type ATP synthase assembly protein I